MAEKKNSYTVDSPIKRNGELYKPGDMMKLTEEEADGLNVSPAKTAKGSAKTPDDEDEGADKKAPETPDESDEDESEESPKVSTDMSWQSAVKMIETADFTALEGFVPEDEDRPSVLEAWEQRQQAEAEES